METGTIQKRCVVCGKDVANEKRTKDPQGNYYCEPCRIAKTAGASAAAVAMENPISPPPLPEPSQPSVVPAYASPRQLLPPNPTKLRTTSILAALAGVACFIFAGVAGNSLLLSAANVRFGVPGSRLDAAILVIVVGYLFVFGGAACGIFLQVCAALIARGSRAAAILTIVLACAMALPVLLSVFANAFSVGAMFWLDTFALLPCALSTLMLLFSAATGLLLIRLFFCLISVLRTARCSIASSEFRTLAVFLAFSTGVLVALVPAVEGAVAIAGRMMGDNVVFRTSSWMTMRSAIMANLSSNILILPGLALGCALCYSAWATSRRRRLGWIVGIISASVASGISLVKMLHTPDEWLSMPLGPGATWEQFFRYSPSAFRVVASCIIPLLTWLILLLTAMLLETPTAKQTTGKSGSV